MPQNKIPREVYFNPAAEITYVNCRHDNHLIPQGLSESTLPDVRDYGNSLDYGFINIHYLGGISKTLMSP